MPILKLLESCHWQVLASPSFGVWMSWGGWHKGLFHPYGKLIKLGHIRQCWRPNHTFVFIMLLKLLSSKRKFYPLPKSMCSQDGKALSSQNGQVFTRGGNKQDFPLQLLHLTAVATEEEQSALQLRARKLLLPMPWQKREGGACQRVTAENEGWGTGREEDKGWAVLK